MENAKVTLPSGSVLTVRKWLTGADKRALQAALLTDVRIETGADGKPRMREGAISADTLAAAENKLLELVIVDIDGTPDDIVKRVLEMRGTDYDAVIKTANDVSNGFFSEGQT